MATNSTNRFMATMVVPARALAGMSICFGAKVLDLVGNRILKALKYSMGVVWLP